MSNLYLTVGTDADNPIEGDLHLEAGQISLVTGALAIAQSARTRFRFFRGEWFLDQRLGIPYFQEVLVKNPDLVLLEAMFREVILTTAGIKTITAFEFSLDAPSRHATLRWEALTDDDEPLAEDFSELLVEIL